MRIERSSHGNILVIEAGGRVDSASAEQLGSFLAYEIDAGGRSLVLDFAACRKHGAGWALGDDERA